MSQNRKLSVPADNPQYFSVTASPGQGAAMPGELPATPRLTPQDLGDLEPTMTTEVVQSLINIEKLAEKQSSTKSKTKRRLGSLFSLFSSGHRRGSTSGVENEYIPTPAGQAYGSLPSTPTKISHNNNNLFRLSTDSSKTLHRGASIGTPISPAKSEAEARPYYNIDNKSATLRLGSKTPAKNSKPPPGPSLAGRLQTPQKVRSISGGNTIQRSVDISHVVSVMVQCWPRI